MFGKPRAERTNVTAAEIVAENRKQVPPPLMPPEVSRHVYGDLMASEGPLRLVSYHVEHDVLTVVWIEDDGTVYIHDYRLTPISR